ncbi:MAG: S8 family serine peptidase [Lachnospiraceae bacterium]|nr:S8 family serine peptidase [Lachnospiraceae bacterium]
MKKLSRKLIAMLLVLVMTLSVAGPAARTVKADTVDAAASQETSGAKSVELGEIDPATLNVPVYGAIDEKVSEKGETDEVPTGYQPNDIVRVSIFLDAPSTLDKGYAVKNIASNSGAKSYRESLRQQQAKVTSAIESAIGKSLKVKWNLTLAANAIAAEVRYADIAKIGSIDGVKSVYIEKQYEAYTADTQTAGTSQFMTNAFSAWQDGYTGAGSRLAIIDTGLDTDHQSFSAEAFDYAISTLEEAPDLLTADEVDASQLNSKTANYISSKIPYGYNYIDENTTVNHLSDRQEEHGSHVAGIAAANRYVKVGDEFVDAIEAVHAVGQAPDAQVLVMKVFGKGGGAYDSDYFAAIEDALVLQADSVNLSLGSGDPGFALAGEYQDIMDRLVATNTVVSISAGNSYSWDAYLEYHGMYAEDASFATGGSPGSFTNSLTVAAADNVTATGMPAIFNEAVNVFYTDADAANAGHIPDVAGSYEYVYIYGTGSAEEYAAVNEVCPLEGKVVIVNRGAITFSEKGNNAIPYSPVALLIANIQPGTISMNIADYTGSFPMASFTLEDAINILFSSVDGGQIGEDLIYVTGSVEITADLQTAQVRDRANADITSFSSWGPNGSLQLKPEITAPGGNIYSLNGTHLDKDSGAVVGGTDQYELMSGTSMAAPHITGLAAVLGEYIRENNLTEKTGRSARYLINSLLMSTATPMNGYPILQQGSGLVDVYAATRAKSYISMDETATASYADGKVKVELGQDADRNGVYKYSFEINNFSDSNLKYQLDSTLFTQAVEDGELLHEIRELNGEIIYSWESKNIDLEDHDVNKDGVTDQADSSAILAYLVGNESEENLNLAVGEMDGVEGISSRDAYELLAYLNNNTADEELNQLIVPAGESVKVTATIQLSAGEKAKLNKENKGGAYIEGFTMLYAETITEEGEILDASHYIPILGYYGSWTDASMFDAGSVVERAYGSEKTSYFGANTNYLAIKYPGARLSAYMGNPYTAEDEFPADRLAMNSNTALNSFNYLLLRDAATLVPVISKDDGSILFVGAKEDGVDGAWYYVNGSTWYENTAKSIAIGGKVKDLGLEEGEKFTIGLYAVPEYYALAMDPEVKDSALTAEQILDLMKSSDSKLRLGDGAVLGNYTIGIDDEAPVMTATADDPEAPTQITVTAKDDQYIAYLALMDLAGNTIEGIVPEQTEAGQEVTYTFTIPEGCDETALVIYCGDYARNEAATVFRLKDGPIYKSTTVYMLTDTLEAGKNYIIANTDQAGTAYALQSQGQNYYTTAAATTVITDEKGTYIPLEVVSEDYLWAAEDGIQFFNVNDGGGLGYAAENSPYVSWANLSWADSFTYNEDKTLTSSGTEGMSYQSGRFYYVASATPVYLYTETTLQEEYDPFAVESVTLDPAVATLIPSIGLDTLEISAGVSPITAEDKTLTWTSSDEEIATVSPEGVVKATGTKFGTITITAASSTVVDDVPVAGTATIAVVDSQPMDATVRAQAAFGKDDVQFVEIDLSNMSTTKLGEAFSAFYGGGQAGEYVYGNDSDNDFHRFKVDDGYAYDSEYSFSINPIVAALDLANFTNFDVPNGEEDPLNTNILLANVSPRGYLCFFIDDEDGNVSYFDLSEITTMVGLASMGASDGDDGTIMNYGALGLDGHLYMFEVSASIDDEGEVDFGLDYYDLGEVGTLVFGEDATAYSMTLHETEEEWGFFVADNTSKAIYYIDLVAFLNDEPLDAKFIGVVDGATNLSTLHNNDEYTDAARIDALLEHAPAAKSAASQTLQLHPVVKEEVVTEEVVETTEEVVEETEEAVEEEAEAEAPANETAGGTNALRVVAKKGGAEIQAGSAELRTYVEYAEEVDAYNGLLKIHYDPEQLTLQNIEFHLWNVDFNVDEENGYLTIAYADLTAIPADEPIITLSFSAACEATTVVVTTEEVNDNLEAAAPELLKVRGAGHVWGTEPEWIWEGDEETGYTAAKAVFTCEANSAHTKEVEAEITTEKGDGVMIYTATAEFEGETYTDTKEAAFLSVDVTRLYGGTRYKTAIASADLYKTELSINKFDAIIVATGMEFADALTGAYLAVAKNAPILLVNNTQNTPVRLVSEYIQNNMNEGGTVYVLGGEKAVDATVFGKLETAAQAVSGTVERISGGTRYTTNTAILTAAGIQEGMDLIITTGTEFANALTVSSTGNPVLVVNPENTTLLNAQKKILESAQAKGCTFTIIGNEVSQELEAAIGEYGTVTRIAGEDQHLQIVEKYFDTPDTLTVVRGKDFADGLSVGLFATAKKAPIVLVDDAEDGGDAQKAIDITSKYTITKGYVISGPKFISDEAITNIFGAGAEITVIFNE